MKIKIKIKSTLREWERLVFLDLSLMIPAALERRLVESQVLHIYVSGQINNDL